jgi:23S rRNA pseudouridine2605 synthase
VTERIQKVLARAGVASRRAAERLIDEGRVRVNGEVVTERGTRVDPARDTLTVDGRKVAGITTGHRYLALHKPKGFVTTLSDPEGRPSIADLIEPRWGRVFPVGRLDLQTEGLILLTDDGDLARDLMHPSSSVPKTYRAKVRGVPARESLERVARGVVLDGKKTRAAEARFVRSTGRNAWVELTVVEGRKHQVRRMLQAIGHPVVKLQRTRFDGVALGGLRPGQARSLTRTEIARLRRAVQTRPARPN